MLGFPGRPCSGQPSSVTQKIKTVTSGSRTTETFTACRSGRARRQGALLMGAELRSDEAAKKIGEES